MMGRGHMAEKGTKEDLNIKDKFYKLESLQVTLYHAGENGMTIAELARKQEVSTKTIKRWLEEVEKNNVFPVWFDDDRCGVVMSRYLPPLNLRTIQALYIFLACRILVNSANRKDSELSSLFYQLSSALPPTIKKEVDKTLTLTLGMSQDTVLQHKIEQLAQAWIDGKSVEITYRGSNDTAAKKRIIDIYFMQPSNRTTYVIAYCHTAKDIRVFKIERIESVSLQKDSYIIPDSFDADSYLSSAWGIIPKDPENVRIRIDKEVIPFITETVWHKSQTIEKDKTHAIVNFNVGITDEVINWIMQWGEHVEVLEPKSLRDTISQKAQKMAKLYGKK